MFIGKGWVMNLNKSFILFDKFLSYRIYVKDKVKYFEMFFIFMFII